MAWRKRLFKALVSGFRQGYAPRTGTSVQAKEVDNSPVIAAVGEEGASVVDGKLRNGQIETEHWDINDGKEVHG